MDDSTNLFNCPAEKRVIRALYLTQWPYRPGPKWPNNPDLWDWGYQANFIGMRSVDEPPWGIARADVYIRESSVVSP